MGFKSNKKFTIGIIDDQILFAQSLAELIRTFEFIDSVVVCDPPTERLFIPPDDLYDLILLDLLMPYQGGFSVLKKIKAFSPEQKVVILSSKEDSLSIQKAKKLNAFGYLFKNIDRHTLREALVDLLINDKEYFLTVQDPKDKNSFVFKDGTQAYLTLRELDFLKLLLKEYTTKDIAMAMSISEHTVIGYRKVLFHKLSVHNMIGLAKYASEIFS